MKILLKEFQEEAVTKLARYMRAAARDSRSGDRQSVCLSSTTGSGKTVMLTAAIERLLQGDDEHPPISNSTFLWITDQPELNEQTRKKMLATSSALSSENLLVIDSTYDQEVLCPGAVHFLNIQKLGKDKGLVTTGDRRTYSIWEAIRNTIESRPGEFFVILDEAHRGMTEDKGQAEAASIVQKFIKGSPSELPPVPVVVGISATPERFNRLIVGTGRANRPVDVDVADVRASGLIKDRIVLHHPTQEQPTDMTMLREAARSLKSYADNWTTYCASQQEFDVKPLLVVQVEDSGGKGQVSETDIPEAIRVLRDELGNFPSDAFAHSFQEGMTLKLSGGDLRYLAPSDIQNDQSVKVIFFKTSLNTGWDCPRAEVMMSFRTAADSTYIAQLVGRMVRTPLARRIGENEYLNTVALYLPHYDKKGLEAIVARLSRPDDGMPPIDVEDSEAVVNLNRAPGTEKIFEVLSGIPSYIVPRARKVSQIRRVMKLARLLTDDEIDPNAVTTAKSRLLESLNKEYERSRKTKRFKEIVDDRRQIEIEAVNWDVGTENTYDGRTIRIDIASENVDDLFEATGRKLNEGLHKLWWRGRVKLASANREKAKLELFALCIDPDVIRAVEKTAQALVQKWLHAHRLDISKLEERSRAGYDEVRSLASAPELNPLVFPTSIHAKRGETMWKKHLYVDAEKSFMADFYASENDVLRRELVSKNTVAWLRNMDRKPWALCVPYRVDGQDKPMYPDFLIVRSENNDLVVDIIDPHTISLADAPAKAAGLARFADQHADKFGRIQLIMIDGTRSKCLELTDEAVRNRVKGVTLPAELRQLFSDS